VLKISEENDIITQRRQKNEAFFDFIIGFFYDSGYGWL
jgi:hypothetical protein